MSDEQHGERVPGWQSESIWRRGEEPEFGRFAFFTDAVFAIALTLLVLDIRLPRDVGKEPGDMCRSSSSPSRWPSCPRWRRCSSSARTARA